MMDHRYSLIEMLRYRRPEGSDTQRIFCEKYLEPDFGEPDPYGNYIKIINHPNGSLPNLCFTAHHDTVHTVDGMQHVVVNGDVAYAVDSNCLGADCTTGVWLILGMIQANVPGIYVVHAGEEVGCVGSSAMIKDHLSDITKYSWLQHAKAVISFDRKGEESIITHQMGSRTASDEFAISLADVLGLPMRPDNTGAYTDSNEYIEVVGECTNISVGYLGQHTKKETEADWSGLVFKREPGEVDPDDYRSWWTSRTGGYSSGYMDEEYYHGTTTYGDAYDGVRRKRDSYSQLNMRGKVRGSNERDLHDLITDYPWELAELLDDLGVDANDLMNQMEELLYLGYRTQSSRKIS
jgi:hypothetical protein